MTQITQMMNSSRANGLQHYLFKLVLEELEVDQADLMGFCTRRFAGWASAAAVCWPAGWDLDFPAVTDQKPWRTVRCVSVWPGSPHRPGSQTEWAQSRDTGMMQMICAVGAFQPKLHLLKQLRIIKNKINKSNIVKLEKHLGVLFWLILCPSG